MPTWISLGQQVSPGGPVSIEDSVHIDHRASIRRGLVAAVVASSTVGLIVDSIVFLWLAFGSLEFLGGQVVGKAWMVLASIRFVVWLRRRDERIGMQSA